MVFSWSDGCGREVECFTTTGSLPQEHRGVIEAPDELRKVRLGTLRKEISVGLDQLERGAVSEYDDQSLDTLAGDIKAKGHKRLAAKKKPRA